MNDVSGVFDLTWAEVGDCKIPVNITLRANECTAFYDKMEVIADEFKDLKAADKDLDGSGKARNKIL